MHPRGGELRKALFPNLQQSASTSGERKWFPSAAPLAPGPKALAETYHITIRTEGRIPPGERWDPVFSWGATLPPPGQPTHPAPEATLPPATADPLSSPPPPPFNPPSPPLPGDPVLSVEILCSLPPR